LPFCVFFWLCRPISVQAVYGKEDEWDRRRLAQEAAYRFISAMADNERGFEEAAFQYEILEKLGSDVEPMLVANLLKEKKRLWVERLAACPLY
jgi:hypothetical protein